MMYTSPDQAKGAFEAKGIEVIRKDNCALTQRVQRGALMTLFKTGSAAKLKQYLERQWTKVLSGSLPLSDFILSGRVRERYRTGGSTTQAELVKRLCDVDPNFKMKNSERISFVIVATPGREYDRALRCPPVVIGSLSFALPHSRYTLKDCVRTPLELMENWDCETIHTIYYCKVSARARAKRARANGRYWLVQRRRVVVRRQQARENGASDSSAAATSFF
jgi:DNA polymerase zeta